MTELQEKIADAMDALCADDTTIIEKTNALEIVAAELRDGETISAMIDRVFGEVE